jgi:putative membrane protein
MRPAALLTITLLAAAAWSPCGVAQIGNPAGLKPGSEEKAPGMPAPNEENTQDRLFVQLVAAGGLAEVEAGKLAAAKGGSEAVKSFGQMMVQDHSKAGEQLAALAGESGIPMPTGPTPDQSAMRARLDSLQDKAFDIAYLRGQLVEHQKTVQILEWEISNGQAAKLQRFAADTLPTVFGHLEMIQRHLSELTGAAPQGLAAATVVAAKAAPRPAGK